jgi:hypothetical protein
MKKAILIALTLALLLTAGCGTAGGASGSAAAPAASASGSAAATPAASAPAPAASSAASSAAASSAAASSAAQGPVTLSALLEDIQSAAPGSAGSSLRQARAAGELLDWAQDGGSAGSGEVEKLLGASSLSPADTAYAWAAVLDEADRILQGQDVSGEMSDAGYTLGHKTYDQAVYRAAVQALSPLFTRAMSAAPGTAYAFEKPTAYSAITLDRFEGIWVDGDRQEMLVITGNTCREVVPYLSSYGETAAAVRVRDRSKMGYCPALEIDTYGKGDFSGALTYYVSGIDDSHFWSNTQGQRFDLLPRNF